MLSKSAHAQGGSSHCAGVVAGLAFLRRPALAGMQPAAEEGQRAGHGHPRAGAQRRRGRRCGPQGRRAERAAARRLHRRGARARHGARVPHAAPGHPALPHARRPGRHRDLAAHGGGRRQCARTARHARLFHAHADARTQRDAGQRQGAARDRHHGGTGRAYAREQRADQLRRRHCRRPHGRGPARFDPHRLDAAPGPALHAAGLGQRQDHCPAQPHGQALSHRQRRSEPRRGRCRPARGPPQRHLPVGPGLPLRPARAARHRALRRRRRAPHRAASHRHRLRPAEAARCTAAPGQQRLLRLGVPHARHRKRHAAGRPGDCAAARSADAEGGAGRRLHHRQRPAAVGGPHPQPAAAARLARRVAAVGGPRHQVAGHRVERHSR